MPSNFPVLGYTYWYGHFMLLQQDSQTKNLMYNKFDWSPKFPERNLLNIFGNLQPNHISVSGHINGWVKPKREFCSSSRGHGYKCACRNKHSLDESKAHKRTLIKAWPCLYTLTISYIRRGKLQVVDNPKSPTKEQTQ